MSDATSHRQILRSSAIVGGASVANIAIGILRVKVVASLLGALASRGDSTALDILMRHLDDEREYVRQWVLASVSSRLSPATALARLRPMANTIKHDDTKKAIGDLIGKLEKQATGSD